MTDKVAEKKKEGLPLPVTTYSFDIVYRFKNDPFTLTATYVAASLAVAFLNKYIVVATEFKFPYPYTVACFQLAIVALPVSALYGLHKVIRPWRQAIPLSAANTCLVFVSPLFLTHVSYHPIMQAVSVPCTLLLLGAVPHAAALFTLCTVVGIFIASCDAAPLSWSGLFYGLLYGFLIALNSVCIQRGLKKTDVWPLLLCSALLSCIFLLPLPFVSGELGNIRDSIMFLHEGAFWFQLVLGGWMAMGLRLLAFLLVKIRSPIAHMAALGSKVRKQDEYQVST
ncbi:hypothetical protein BCR43DRAFT_517015 [Syncephalastrum racemosum]|uniref:Sugar phosphate transporter domain-containing protein n=1 Tax=Syncephalastrum racemosum TaxID=13706 RepID=A0A1X2H699_SYNRA|nr:hypothetical protein BCR43DRAFT_517015 [Syncephalastrum racemosum]